MATAWGKADLVGITVNAVAYYFMPNQLVYMGQPETTRNQIRQESESGIVKIQEIDSNTRLLYEFRINRMPYTQSVTVDAVTCYGFATLYSILTGPTPSGLNFMAATCSLKPTGTAVAGAFSARLVSATLPATPAVLKVGYWGTASTPTRLYMGDGSQSIVFRKEIT